MITLKVDGMSCDHCIQTITNAIHTVDAQAGVHIDLKQGIVNVQTRAAEESITTAITDTGFDVTDAVHSAGT
ncbi:MAG: heavy-metal-associated domain-containing protein [Chitinophagaceae bacterium]|nr:heavy-metal-associated domain-containing protein [Oligoflexus sp.]